MTINMRIQHGFLSASHAPSLHTAHPAQATSSVDADAGGPLKESSPDDDAKYNPDLSFLDVSHM